jgi:lipoteichoic acid synthase
MFKYLTRKHSYIFKYFTFVILSLSCLISRGSIIEIRYYVPDAENVTMIWGVNDWATIANRPAGTIIKDKVMCSPMVKEGDDYVLKLMVPDNSTVDYIFHFTKKAGPFKVNFDYYDNNERSDGKYYNSVVNGNSVIRVAPDINKLKPTKYISLLKYSVLVFLLFLTLGALLFFVKKSIFKAPLLPLNQTALFFAISITVLITLFIIRAYITGGLEQFLIDPLQGLPLLLKNAFQDFIYTAILTLLFGVLFFIKKEKKYRRVIFWIFGSFAVLSIIICIANIKITALLGMPFNYRWLYYSDFLLSSDALNAIGDNIDKGSLLANLVMIIAIVPLVWCIYQLLVKGPVLTAIVLVICFGTASLAKSDLSIDKGKKANPIMYFVSSLFEQNSLSTLSGKTNVNQFSKKNKNVLQPQYASAFQKANIKNVIVFVLESTPAEYITPYNSLYKATPFLDSIKSSSLFFDAAYAHAPATNKSLVSILCGSYPYLSYKAITAEKPDIKWPSISSELKKNGYRTSFINSGDNRFQGADRFLQHRGMSEIQDFRQNTCAAPVFSDSRYVDENLEGINDECLTTRFFDWIKDDQSTPFFSMMWTYQTHYPYFSTGKKIDFNSKNPSLEKYLNALHNADRTLRQLVEGLKERDLFNSTLIVVLGDHGEAFGRHGQTSHAGGIYEENLHIPLILINPQLFKGERISEVAGSSDVAPTIFSILGKPIPNEWQGENLFSINRRNKVYFFSPFSDWLFGCREGNYKFIYNATTNVPYLYDLKTDPFESINIANKHPKYVKELHDHLNSWIQYQVQYINSFLK